ncbi:peptidoglycan-recognition protein SB2-like isoform X3 [Macrosteles quadrilineatus]|uniref:peptidoglycan-recognition protein SB2-like isoform X3 n=1 Tax=Macrosteles quadrilineatus TaxID=74068 RepID=UPI0023E0C725|nr:peptidoglycan-recognition protein SB2-like isoform X3 [Macrosteles quadrilineatus]
MSGSDQKNEEVSLQNTENTQIQKEDEDIPPPPLDDDEPMSSEVRLPHPTVIYRSSWGAQAPRGEMEELKLPMEEVLITFTGTDECLTNHECLDAVDLIQRRDIQGRGLADIQYNFLIGGDGVVYEGRGLLYHAHKDKQHMDLKGKSLDIAYIGDFSDKVPLKRIYRTCASLIQMLVEYEYLTNQFHLTPLGKSQSIFNKGDGCVGPECFLENHEDVNWRKYPGFQDLDEMLEKNLL